jgi:hypothetical protein
MTSFSKCQCTLIDCCLAQMHEIQKHFPGSNGLIHIVCGQALEQDEASFEVDSVVCSQCDPQKQQQSQQPQQPQQHSPPVKCLFLLPCHQLFINVCSNVVNYFNVLLNLNECQGRSSCSSLVQTHERGKNHQKLQHGNQMVKVSEYTIRRRVNISWSRLYHILSTDEQCKIIPKDIPNKIFWNYCCAC